MSLFLAQQRKNISYWNLILSVTHAPVLTSCIQVFLPLWSKNILAAMQFERNLKINKEQYYVFLNNL